MNQRIRSIMKWVLPAAAVVAGIAAVSLSDRWLPASRHWLANLKAAPVRQAESPIHDDHDTGTDEHDHGHDSEAAHTEPAGAEEADHDHASPVRYDHKHDEASAIKLSKQAEGTIGLRLARLELRDFERTTTVPGIVVERPGWSVLDVTSPMTGVVTRIHPIQGEAVHPGQPLFEIRLTHEDLLEVQTEFLRTIEELDVIGHEIRRLEKAANDGAIPGKTYLERTYERQKLEASLRAQRQAMLLHGLSQEQIEKIVSTRTLLQSLTISAPARQAPSPPDAAAVSLEVQDLKVAQGKFVTAGTTLCTLADHSELYIEGQAFEQDMQTINRAVAAGWKVSAVLGAKSTGDEQTIQGLHVLYLDGKVDQQSRAFHFYVVLPNRLAREDHSPDGRRFVYWQFRPGQRTQVRIPVEQWTARLVLPVEAVAQDGAEAYVFEANGDHFDRRAVHVEYRDQDWAVIAKDGELRAGATVAASAAHQMQLALKNKAGGGVDPHAGHNH